MIQSVILSQIFAASRLRNLVLLTGAIGLAVLAPLPSRGQVLQYEQNLESVPGPVPPIAYSGTISLTANTTATNNGSPNNAKYYSEATGTYAWTLVNGGTGAATQTMVFRNVRFGTGSTNNSISFLLTAISNNPNKGLMAADNVKVEVSADYGTTYYPVLTVTGNNNATNGSGGFSNGVVWGYRGNVIAPGSLTAAGAFDGLNPSAPQATYVPALLTSISANTSNSNVTGSGGYGKVSIAMSNVTNAMVRVTMSNSLNQQVWGVDEFKVFSSAGAALPVELTRFGAAAEGSGVRLNWTTASEKNSESFEVQRSADGKTYQVMGKVAAQGSSSSLHEYEFRDARPLAGLTYYRLRQIDTDGSSAYSPVATARARANAETLAYPNPTSGLVMLPAVPGLSQYRLLDAVGRPVLRGPAASGGQLDLGPLPRGTFWLELTDAGGRHLQRLVRE